MNDQQYLFIFTFYIICNFFIFESENIDKLVEAINNIELTDNKNVNKEIINKFSTETVSSEYYSLINKLI